MNVIYDERGYGWFGYFIPYLRMRPDGNEWGLVFGIGRPKFSGESGGQNHGSGRKELWEGSNLSESRDGGMERDGKRVRRGSGLIGDKG